VVCQLI